MIKISLIISLLTYIMFWLIIYRASEIYKRENKHFKEKKLGLYNHIRIIIIVLIPVFNIICLIAWGYYFLFVNDKDTIKEFIHKEDI